MLCRCRWSCLPSWLTVQCSNSFFLENENAACEPGALNETNKKNNSVFFLIDLCLNFVISLISSTVHILLHSKILTCYLSTRNAYDFNKVLSYPPGTVHTILSCVHNR